jgi:integrase
LDGVTARHDILGGKVQLYKRLGGRFWQCSASIGGNQHRATTKKEELAQAQDAAEEWYLILRGMVRNGVLIPAKKEKTFADAAQQFLLEFPVITDGQRNKQYVQGHERRLNLHLLPFMGDKPLSKVTSGLVQEYRIYRAKPPKKQDDQPESEQDKKEKPPFKPPAPNTIHQEIVVLRQVLKTALRHDWISGLPDLSQPYKTNSKISHRAWFSPEEYQKLYKYTHNCAVNPPIKDLALEYAELHDSILFLANTGLRPDEAVRLEYRDVSIVDDDASGETILVIECRGKRGYGPCKSTANAVRVFRRLQKRNEPQPTDRIFPKLHSKLFNTVLNNKDLQLKHDREGLPRTFYSLRHTYISFRLLEGANIVQLSWNCRTSIPMIEKYYASHIKTRIDAAAVNVRRKKPGETERMQRHERAKEKAKEQARFEQLRQMLREVVAEELATNGAVSRPATIHSDEAELSTPVAVDAQVAAIDLPALSESPQAIGLERANDNEAKSRSGAAEAA